MMEENHNDDDLARQLAALPRERLPSAQVWQQLAARLQQEPHELPAAPIAAQVAPAREYRRRPRRWPWLVGAAAAVLALAAVMTVSQPEPPRTVAVRDTPIQRQANVLTHEYRQAIATIPNDTVPVELRPALAELDASAGSIRTAINESPHAGFLLGQLQRTYALRLELTRQGLAAAGLST